MESNTEGNLLEVMDLARTLRQEQLFIQQEQTTFAQLTGALAENSASITKLAYICAQQRKNLNDLIVSRPDLGPSLCCRRAKNYDNVRFIDAKKVLDYECIDANELRHSILHKLADSFLILTLKRHCESKRKHAIAYENLFDYLYKSSYVLALSLATGDSLADISPAHMNSVIQTITTGLFGNAINTKDVEMVLKLLRELIEIQISVSDNPRRLLKANASTFARIYHRLNESMFSAKIFLTAALFQPIMSVLSETDTMLDVDPRKVVQSFTTKEKIRRFGLESSSSYQENIDKFHMETLNKLYKLSNIFIDSLLFNWSLFPSTLRWLVQTMYHQLKQAHQFSDKVINETITDMVFTHFICPAIVSPDVMGIIDAPISEQVRFNLIQIGQIIQMLALAKHDDIDNKFAELYAKFETNNVTKLIDLLLVTQSGEDVVAILAQQSDFERTHLLITQRELNYLTEFYRILAATDEFDISEEEKEKLRKMLKHLPENTIVNGNAEGKEKCSKNESPVKEKSKQSLKNLSKSTKSKIAKSMSFSNANGNANLTTEELSTVTNANSSVGLNINGFESSSIFSNSKNSSPVRVFVPEAENESVLVFNLYNGVEQKLQPLSEEEVLKMNSIGQDISNGELVDAENYQQESTVDKSSVVNGFDGIDGISDILRPMHSKNARFSLSHDDASIGNSDNLEAVSEVPSNHSVTSSLELEENAENDNLSDMVSANVSGRGTPNISGRDTPSSQVTDGESINNALPTPQMQKLISKARSDIQDKFCKFEIKKFEGDETVSIISDTWSTDVLASDSETVDTTERERERNFSTPLIPAAVVLPGDNNFDVLSGAGGIRTGYLDASDQRSESNWSTDVLASDSEKLNEIDTDDNVSITARSDILDSGATSERERSQAAASTPASTNRQHKSSNNCHYSSARNNRSFRSPSVNAQGVHKLPTANAPSSGSVDDVHGSGGSSGGNASDRSQEDSAFYDAINSYDDNSASVTNNNHYHHHYRDGSSLARSSVRTSNRLENSFQQNYKSIPSEKEKDNFLQAGSSQRMKRQTSAESSISNQSVNLEEHAVMAKISSPFEGNLKNPHKICASNESKDLIDFSDFCDEKDLVAPTSGPPVLDIFQDDLVERRDRSTLQRNSGVDGRRNGILALKGGRESLESGSNLIPSLRRHQSLNYENHEIMLNAVPKRISALPNISPQTDDDKREQQKQEQEILLLANRASDLKITDDSDGRSADQLRSTPINQTSASIVVYSSASAATQNVQKPIKSTGAIPKSISFDASADKAHGQSASSSGRQNRNSSRFQADPLRGNGSSTSNGLTSHNSGIFNKLKQGIFKHRRGHKSRHHSATNFDEVLPSPRSVSFSNNNSEVSLDIVSANVPTFSTATTQERSTGYYDISEDILAKYRRKVSTSSEATNSSNGNGAGAIGGATVNCIVKDINDQQSNQHSSIHDKIIAFNIIKKKIRTVLSKTDLHSGDFRHTTHTNISPLITYLQIQLAQAINLQNFQQISYVSEAIRCISQLDIKQHTQIMDELQNDIQKRQSYLQYLMRYRQNLLMIMENIEQYESRLKSESATCNRYLMAVCMRLFFEKKQEKIESFQEDFARLTVSDDKVDLIEEFIESLMEELLSVGGFLNGMPEWQIVESRMSLERILLQNMYQQVMFPNEDADLSRDTVLSDHIRKLQNVITPSHPALCIPQVYLSEAPWSFAQQELTFITAYKTPREKLQCVIRCISSIMSLLHMSSGRVPAADDILPVLIYVVIMANPPYLLSTVEYITCFIGEKLDGEEQFHWTLFGSVVKFIKTMDYLDQ